MEPAASSCWSDLHEDLLSEITKRLDMPGFFRFGVVCSSWHQSTLINNNPTSHLRYLLCNQKNLQPWLILSSPENPQIRHLYSLTEQKYLPIPLPEISGHHFVGSSHGYLISVDSNANLHATNPITGTHLPIPPSVGNYFYTKVILSPSLDYVVAVRNGDVCTIAFARPGDARWTKLCSGDEHNSQFVDYQDVIFLKGCLYVVTLQEKIIIFDLKAPAAPVSLLATTTPDDMSVYARRYFAPYVSTDNFLFLISRYLAKDKDGVYRTTGAKMFLFDDIRIDDILIHDVSPYAWYPIGDLDVAFILGLNHSFMLLAKDYPCFKGRHIYVTTDNNDGLSRRLEDRIENLGVEVFSFEDGNKCTQPIYPKNDLDNLSWPAPIWFVPSLK